VQAEPLPLAGAEDEYSLARQSRDSALKTRSAAERSAAAQPVEENIARESLTPPDDNELNTSAQSVEDILREAGSCRANRDWSCSAHAYERVIEMYPSSAEAAMVLVLLAQIELDNFHRPTKALDLYQSYRQKMPHGPLAEEALYGICKAWAALGESLEESRALSEFLALYPNSAYASNARRRLLKITDNQRQ